MQHNPRGGQPAIRWHVVFIKLLLPLKAECFVLIKIDSYSAYGFAFSACRASAKTTIHVLTECLIHSHGIPVSIPSNQEIHFTTKVQQWIVHIKFTGVAMCHHHPKEAGFIE